MLDTNARNENLQWDSPITDLSGVSDSTAEKYSSSTVGELISSEETLSRIKVNWFWDAATDVLRVDAPNEDKLEIENKFQTISRAKSLDSIRNETSLIRRLSPSEEYELRSTSHFETDSISEVTEIEGSFSVKPLDGEISVIKTDTGRKGVCPKKIIQLSQLLFGENNIESFVVIVDETSSWKKYVVQSNIGLEIVAKPDWEAEDGIKIARENNIL